ncbi:MAG: hypothetical protein H6658_04770 [Ardenticatenaceae bacterium]|nr:hypothetical protein [Ardenticatenaceae bacterium]
MTRFWQDSNKRTGLLCGLLLLFLIVVFLRHALVPPADLVLGRGYDVRGLTYLWYQTILEALRAGRLPLWDDSLFSGYPFLMNPQVGFFYPPAWIPIILPLRLGLTWYAIFHLWMLGWGMTLFVRKMSGSWLGGLLAGLVLTFSGFMSVRIWDGHLVLIATHVWLPWMLLGLVWSVRRGDGWSAMVAAVPLALTALAGHTTTLLYVGLIWGLFAIYLFVTQPKRWLVVRQTAVIGTVGLALSMVQWAALIEFSLLSTRVSSSSFEFATDFSLPLAHLITILLPEYFGEPVRSGYWSVPTFVELTIYAGILPVLGLILALKRPSRLTWFYVLVMIMGILLALGRYGFLYRLFFDLLPPFRLARAPGRASFMYIFAAAALLGETVAIWRKTPAEANRAALATYWRWVLVTGAVIAIAALAATGATFAAQHPTDTSGRLWQQIGGWGWALALFVTGGLLLWGYVTAGGNGRQRAYAVGLVLLVITDLWVFGFKMIELSPTAPEPFWLRTKAIVGETYQRIVPWGLSIFWQNGAGEVGLRSVFGYNALETSAFQEFIGSVPDPRATTYDILGAEFVVAQVALEDYMEGERPLTLYEHEGDAWVYRRGRVLPIARLVDAYEVIADNQEAINRIHAPDFDPTAVAILAEEPGCAVSDGGETAVAQILEERDGYWRIATSSETPALLVLSESAYPGWRVMVDGQTADPLTAYTVIRAVCVPAGEHVVEWSFQPTVYTIGGIITILALLLVGVAVWKLRGTRD